MTQSRRRRSLGNPDRFCPSGQSTADETQPPFALQPAEKCVALFHGGHNLGVAGVDQCPWTFPPQPAVAVGQILHETRLDAALHPCPPPFSGLQHQMLPKLVRTTVPRRKTVDLPHTPRL